VVDAIVGEDAGDLVVDVFGRVDGVGVSHIVISVEGAGLYSQHQITYS